MPEQQNIEYKQSWHDDYLKWVCGFANAIGGIIYFCESYGIAKGLLITFGGKSLDFTRVYNKNLVNPVIKKSCLENWQN